MRIESDYDLVLMRQRAGQIAARLGYDALDQTRVATAASETARILLSSGVQGVVEFSLDSADGPALAISFRAEGSVSFDWCEMEGDEQAPGEPRRVGAPGVLHLVDRIHLEGLPGQGLALCLRKNLPKGRPAPSVSELAAYLESAAPRSITEEFRTQNQELVEALKELRQAQSGLATINQELLDTNHGVMALYRELEEKNQETLASSDQKSRLLANLSHELRTPLISITSLAGALLDRADGDLNPEQEKQVRFIEKAGRDLMTLVEGLLDLARLQASQSTVHAVPFEVGAFFSSLKGMFRPIAHNPDVDLVVNQPLGIPTMVSDEIKIGQIIRNLVTNAIKFTERGQVVVSGSLDVSGHDIVFSVADTGIGIAPEDQERVFGEFIQLQSKLSRQNHGAGLGLALVRKLTGLLGGTVWVDSELGKGSTFYVRLPLDIRTMPSGGQRSP